ncbi:hypothetical protein ACLB1G_11230 [Oxalobacteraceae bacterium A2-2]
MKDIAEKLRTVEQRLSDSGKPFSLFALLWAEAGSNRWNLLASADWLQDDRLAAMRVIAAEMNKLITKDEIVRLSGIVIIETGNPGLDAVCSTYNVAHGMVEVNNAVLFGVEIKRGYIITARRDISPVSAAPSRPGCRQKSVPG